MERCSTVMLGFRDKSFSRRACVARLPGVVAGAKHQWSFVRRHCKRLDALRAATSWARAVSRGWSALVLTLWCLGLILLSGCAGYQIGNQSLYPAHIRTVYVPMFESGSFRRNLGERLTEAVTKEIELKTPYKVVGTPDADSVLTGRITGETKRVLVENRYDDPRQFEVNLRAEVTWIDRQGNVLRRSGSIPLPPRPTVVGGTAEAVPEVGQSVATAHQQAIHCVAEQIVAMMEEPW